MEVSEKKQPLEKRYFNVEINGVTERIPGLSKEWLEVEKRHFSRYLSHPEKVDGVVGEKELWLEMTKYVIDDLEWLLRQKYHIFWSYVIFSKSVKQLLVSFLQEAPPSYMRSKFPKDREMEEALEKTEKLVFLVFVRLSKEEESESDYVENLGQLLYDNYVFTVPILLDICSIYGTRNRNLVLRMISDVVSASPNYLNDFREIFHHLIHVLSIVREKFEINEISMFNEKSDAHLNEMLDLVLHLHDSTTTVQLFMNICSSALNLPRNELLSSEIASFYSAVLPPICKYFRMNDCQSLRDWNPQELIENIRYDLLFIVRGVFCSIVNDVLNCSYQAGECANEYLTNVMGILHEPIFLRDMKAIHSIEGDLTILSEICPEMDSENFSYVTNAIAPEEADESRSVIDKVKRIFPMMEDGAIDACLKYFDNDPERVIRAVIEKNVPEELLEISAKTEPIPEPDPKQKKLEEMMIKNKEMFDVMNDKSELMEIKDKFADWVISTDDEYDDTYDDQFYDANRVDVDDYEGKRFVTPRVLAARRSAKLWRDDGEDEDDDDDDEEEEEEEEVAAAKNSGKTLDHFVPNPEEVRAKQEQRREERRRRDYVGKGRGQGQDKQVLANREYKNAHKSNMANHNRRKFAARKRNMPFIQS